MTGFVRLRRYPSGHDRRPQQDLNLRSRLRSPAARSSEFVHPACLDSIAHLAGRRAHSAYIPDHENLAVTARSVQGTAEPIDIGSGAVPPGARQRRVPITSLEGRRASWTRHVIPSADRKPVVMEVHGLDGEAPLHRV